MSWACCTGLSPSYTQDQSTRCRMIPWKTTALHLLLHLTGLQAQEIAHLLTLASLHLVFSSAGQVIEALIAVFILLASEETRRKQGGKDRRHPRRGARKAIQTNERVQSTLFQKAEIPISIRTCCLSNKNSWQTQLTSLEKTFVSINDTGKENKRWNRRETTKEQKLCKNRRQGQRPFVLPVYGKVMPHDKEITIVKGTWEYLLLTDLHDNCLPFPRSLSPSQKYK